VSKPKILVTGGCGFIGSHTIVDLIQSGYDVVSLDNGLNSSLEVVEGIEAITGQKVMNVDVDLSQTGEAIEALKPYGPFNGIIHFAALKSVEESVFQPLKYYQNNVGGTMTTMAIMEEMDIPYLIFSSSCTVYGKPDHLPVTEDTPIRPAENPYGATKQVGEILYDQFFNTQPNRSGISLRYFNPAGAHPSALIGEASINKATNLVPVITETAYGLRNELSVFGNDFPTRDGSCIRDYIHVTDLAKAHTLAMDFLMKQKNQKAYEVFNLGIGNGVTVLEAIAAFEEATGVMVNYKIAQRRAGDVDAIYANNKKITDQLGWRPTEDIQSIMRSAWAWEKVRRK
jgi:UDP-glucose 4-epimerase